jgi:CubicO group peptidase (beta-lactamase class C family)
MAFDRDTPVRRDSIFRLASTTKPITAVAAMTLVEECRLRLDDPLDEWLPELRDGRVLRMIDAPLDDTVAATRPLTLRDLLTFGSGYGDFGLFAPGCPFQKGLEDAGLSISTWPSSVS